jgi:hypothetical protein
MARDTIANFFNIARQKLAIAAVFCKTQGLTIAASGRKLITSAVRPTSLAGPNKTTTYARAGRMATSKERSVGRTGAVGIFLISICFGLLCICGVMIAVLFVQLRDMKIHIAQWEQNLATTEARLNRVEKITQDKIANESQKVNAQQRHIPITLGNDDIRAIRGFIKVLPSKPGTQQKIQLGDEISDMPSTPVPESLVSRLPKLRGASFLIDQNGAIIIIGEGSKRADAVIEPQ